jgi:hypothetical protein
MSLAPSQMLRSLRLDPLAGPISPPIGRDIQPIMSLQSFALARSRSLSLSLSLTPNGRPSRRRQK